MATHGSGSRDGHRHMDDAYSQVPGDASYYASAHGRSDAGYRVGVPNQVYENPSPGVDNLPPPDYHQYMAHRHQPPGAPHRGDVATPDSRGTGEMFAWRPQQQQDGQYTAETVDLGTRRGDDRGASRMPLPPPLAPQSSASGHVEGLDPPMAGGRGHEGYAMYASGHPAGGGYSAGFPTQVYQGGAQQRPPAASMHSPGVSCSTGREDHPSPGGQFNQGRWPAQSQRDYTPMHAGMQQWGQAEMDQSHYTHQVPPGAGSHSVWRSDEDLGTRMESSMGPSQHGNLEPLSDSLGNLELSSGRTRFTNPQHLTNRQGMSPHRSTPQLPTTDPRNTAEKNRMPIPPRAGDPENGNSSGDDVSKATKGADLDACIRALISSKSKGSMKKEKLLEKTGLDEDVMDDMLTEYCGIIEDYSVNGKSKKSNKREVRLIPTFHLCPGYQRNKECRNKRCKELHICREYLFKRECEFLGSKDTKSQKRGGKDKKVKSCGFGHSFEDSHNERVLRKVLDVDDLNIFKPRTLLDLVTFCCENYEDSDQDSSFGSNSDSSAVSSPRAGQRKGKKDIGKGKRTRGREQSSEEDDDGDKSRDSSRGWKAATRGGSKKHQDSIHGRDLSNADSWDRRQVRQPRSSRQVTESSGAVGGPMPSSRSDFMTGGGAVGPDVPIVCGDHAKGRCKRAGVGCGKVHAPAGKLYQWQVKEANSNRPWLNLSDRQSDQLEAEFGKPDVTSVALQPWVAGEKSTCFYPKDDASKLMGVLSNWKANFDMMHLAETVTRNGDQRILLLRRVGGYPKDSAGSSSGDSLWHWYFSDNKGRWVKYGDKAEAVYNTGKTTASDLGSDDIEAYFISELTRIGGPDNPADPKAAALKAQPVLNINPLHFRTGYHDYALLFDRMVQKNLGSYATERPICRRPAPAPHLGARVLQAVNNWF